VDGGKITNAVSTIVAMDCGVPSRGFSTSGITKIRGLSIMAMHRATAVTALGLLGQEDSMEDIRRSQSIDSSRPSSETE